jgi:hypothetical protein
MRILVLAALLSGAVWAQAPRPKFFGPAPASDRHLLVPPGSISIKPYFSAGATAAPVAVCAVPLINVEPKSGFNIDPKIVSPGPRQFTGIDHMPVSQGLPSCEPAVR